MIGSSLRVTWALLPRLGLAAVLVPGVAFWVFAQPPATTTSTNTVAAETPAAPAAVAPPKYVELTVAPKLEADLNVRKGVEDTVSRVMRGQLPVTEEANRRVFLAYFTQYRFPQLTQKKNYAQLPKMRLELFQSLIRRTDNQEAHAILVETTFTYMNRLVQSKPENFHPAVRYNAMLIVGELNTTESLREGGRVLPPVPMAQALGFMLAELNDTNQIDAVRAAALLGIARHVEVDRVAKRFTAEQKAHLVEKLKTLVMQGTPPENRSPSGHAWLQRQTIEILAALGSLDDTGELRGAMVALLADENAAPSVRMAAAVALGSLAGPALKIDAAGAADIARKMGAFAAAECRADFEILRDEMSEPEVKSGPGGAVRGGGEGGFPGGPGGPGGGSSGPVDILAEQKRIEPVRRRLKQILLAVQSGLAHRTTGGIAGLAKAAPDAAAVEGIVGDVNALSMLMEKTDLGIKEFVDAMQPPLSKLLTATRGAIVKPTPEGPSAPAGPGAPGTPKGQPDEFDFGN